MLTLFTTYANANGVNLSPIISYLLSETSNSSQALTFKNNTSVPIPDGDSGVGPGMEISEIDVTGATTTITKITITLDITHSLVSDLEIYLISPFGTSIFLNSIPLYRCCNGQNYTNTTFDDSAIIPITDAAPPFTGTYSPWEPLSTFDGENANGIWMLKIYDRVFEDIGTLNSWSITIE